MSSQQRQRNASFSITIPASLLPEIDDAAAGYRSRNAFIEAKIMRADALQIDRRITGLTFSEINALGRSLMRKVAAASQRIPAAETSNLIDLLSFLQICPRSEPLRRSHPIRLEGENRKISVRTLPPIKNRAEINAESAGLSLSNYCLRLLLGHPVYAKPSQDDARIISELGKISGLLILSDLDHLNLFSSDDHHRQATQIVRSLLSQWRST
jgi:hypothetical protein